MEFVFTSTSLLLAVYRIYPLELINIAVSYGLEFVLIILKATGES